MHGNVKQWMVNGVKPAWLIDFYDERIYIYRPGEAEETVTGFDNKLSGKNLLPGFELSLSEVNLTASNYPLNQSFPLSRSVECKTLIRKIQNP